MSKSKQMISNAAPSNGEPISGPCCAGGECGNTMLCMACQSALDRTCESDPPCPPEWSYGVKFCFTCAARGRRDNVDRGTKPKGTSDTSHDAAPNLEIVRPAVDQAPSTKKRLAIMPYRPFPVETLPAAVREYVRESAAALGCDPAYIALPVLAVVASLIGNARTIRLKAGWDEPSVIWSAIVGDSGTLKSPAFQKAVAYLRLIQKRFMAQYKKDLAKYRRKLDEYKAAKRRARNGEEEDPGDPPEQPILPRVTCGDTTIEKLAEILEDNPRGVLVAREELSGWFGSFARYKSNAAGTDMPYWLEMHCAATVMIDRKTGDRRQYYIPRAAASVTGGIQPGVLVRTLGPAFMDSGLTARLLMAMPPRKPKRWSEAEVSQQVEAAYHGIIDKLQTLKTGVDQDGEITPHVLRLSASAEENWIKFYNAFAQEQAASEGELAAAFSKLEAYAARFALLHHVVEHVASGKPDLVPVGPESIDAGVTLARWFAYEARRIYSTLTETAEERHRRRLIEFILSRGGRITPRQLMRSNNRKYPSVSEAEAMLQRLVDDGLGRWHDTPATEQGGRPTRWFILTTTHDETDTTSDNEDVDGDGPPPDKTAA